MTTRRALWGLILVSSLLRLALALSLGPGNDEAYHYLFTVHRDWSYFDHPPMLAAVESLGLLLTGNGPAALLGIRLGFILLFAGSTGLMARLGARYYGPRAGLFAALALNFTAYYSGAAGTFALPDGPLLFFWLLTLDRLSVAFDGSPGRKLGTWAGVGLAWGGALLSKYHAVFLPAGALLYIVLEPSARRWLRSPGPYLAGALGVLLFAPVLAWNAAHGWASFAFQGGRALGGFRFRPDLLGIFVLGQVCYLLPWIWSRLVTIVVRRGLRPFAAASDRFLVCEALVPLATFTAVACFRPVLPHWTLVGFLSVFPILGKSWEHFAETVPRLFAQRLAFMALMPVVIGAVVVLEARTGVFQSGRPGGIGLIDAAVDPTADLAGWDVVARELKQRGLLDRPRTFLFTSAWYTSGQLAFATRRSATPVLCYHLKDARSFAYWSRPEEWVGSDGIFVALNDHPNEPEGFERWFTRIEPLGAFEVRRAGAPLRTIRLFRCVRQTTAFRFENVKPGNAPRRIAAQAARTER